MFRLLRYRDYGKESERRAGVEEFYRINHINQTYAFVSLNFSCHNYNWMEKFNNLKQQTKQYSYIGVQTPYGCDKKYYIQRVVDNIKFD